MESVKAQCNNNWLLLSVNDASIDDTEVVLEGYKNQLGDQFHYVTMPENSGANAVRNHMLEEAKSIDENVWPEEWVVSFKKQWGCSKKRA